jgi:tetrahydromethanopterin S-methyltransferase subunit G
MNQSDRTRVVKLIFDRFAEVLERLDRIEQRLSETNEELDTLDRWRRPYGDGTRPARRKARR